MLQNKIVAFTKNTSPIHCLLDARYFSIALIVKWLILFKYEAWLMLFLLLPSRHLPSSHFLSRFIIILFFFSSALVYSEYFQMKPHEIWININAKRIQIPSDLKRKVYFNLGPSIPVQFFTSIYYHHPRLLADIDPMSNTRNICA